MTSLIDVIFLLLLFFMLSSTFSKYGEVELVSAGAGTGTSLGSSPIFLRLERDVLTLNGRAQPLDRLGVDLDTLRDKDGMRTVLVSLDDGVSSQRLVDLLAILHPITGFRLRVLGGK